MEADAGQFLCFRALTHGAKQRDTCCTVLTTVAPLSSADEVTNKYTRMLLCLCGVRLNRNCAWSIQIRGHNTHRTANETKAT